MKYSFVFISGFLIFSSCSSPANESKKTPEEKSEISKPSNFKTIGSLIPLDSKFNEVVPVEAKIEVLGEGFSWSEGPIWIEKEQMVVWSDVPKNIAYSWKEGEGVKEYLNPSGYTGEGYSEGSNGLLLNSTGELILCQHGNRTIAKMDAPLNAPDEKFVVLADKYDGKRFNSPNDAAYDNEGNLFFTDPPYGLEGLEDDPEKEIPFQGVYRLSPDGTVTLLTDKLTRPNGIAFNPDFSKCYVANSDPNHAVWMEYDLTPDKTFSTGKIFFDATDMVPAKKGLPDGLKVKSDGTVFATGPGGVLVFSSEGKHIGTINTGEHTANCTFNHDESVLFMTANMYMTRIRLKE